MEREKNNGHEEEGSGRDRFVMLDRCRLKQNYSKLGLVSSPISG